MTNRTIPAKKQDRDRKRNGEKMASDFAKAAEEIIEGAGGASNLVSADLSAPEIIICVNNVAKANITRINAVECVRSVIYQKKQYDIYIEEDAADVFAELRKQPGLSSGSGGFVSALKRFFRS